ncbi:hypothetical protein [Bifidobacterium criceti]|nr:hypothetical protein [Bifidobacterium criceti]
MMLEFGEASVGSYEGRLARIAQTDHWDEDDIVDNVKNCQAMLLVLRERIDNMCSWMMQPGVFKCAAQSGMYKTAMKIRDVIDAGRSKNELYVKNIRQAICAYNNGIDEANAVMLPGDRLNAAQEQQIMDTTEPLNVAIPGLGTLTGVMGIAGVNLISQLMSSHREDKAREKYESIQESIGYTDPKAPEVIPVVDIPLNVNIEIDWSRFNIPRGGQGGSSSDNPQSWGGGAAAVAAAAAVGAGAVASRGGHTNVSVSATSANASGGTTGGSAAVRGSHATGASGGSATSGSMQGSAHRTNGSTGYDGRYTGGVNGSNGSNGDYQYDDDNYLYEWDENGTYRYDPDKNAWVRTDAKGVDVDSYSTQGVSNLSSVASGTGVAATGAAAAGIAGRAGAMSSAMAGSTMGAAGMGGSLGSVGAAGGVGSFYANNPVTATITPASSIRGAQGLAAGLQNNAAATNAATGANGRANPAMMGGTGAGGAGGDKKKKQLLGYVAPVIEDDEEFSPTPIGNMAGHRRTAEDA